MADKIWASHLDQVQNMNETTSHHIIGFDTVTWTVSDMKVTVTPSTFNLFQDMIATFLHFLHTFLQTAIFLQISNVNDMIANRPN